MCGKMWISCADSAVAITAVANAINATRDARATCRGRVALRAAVNIRARSLRVGALITRISAGVRRGSGTCVMQ